MEPKENKQTPRANVRRNWSAILLVTLLLVALGVYLDRGAGRPAPELTELTEPPTPAPAVTPPDAIVQYAPIVEPVAAAEPVTASAAPPDDGEALRDATVAATAEAAVRHFSTPLALPAALLRGHGYGYDVNNEDYRFHAGIDLAADVGTSVYAAAAGTVTEAAADAYWSGVVTVDHGGGWRSVYRCLEPAVRAGESVAAGGLLGQVSPAPAEGAEPTHIHFELELNGESQDPAPWLEIRE